MTLILKQLFAFLKMLNSETGHNQIAAGIAAGFILGMTPMLSLQTLLVFICIFFFRIQAGAGILEMESLQGLFTTMYNVPLLPLTRFNNTIVMGSGVVAIVLSPFIYFISRAMILKYRETVLARIKNTKFWKAMQATSLYKWYYTYDNLYG